MKKVAGTDGKGFTIVELLIVIVIIAILAAITIVAYNGISGRAHDSAIQSDLREYGQKVRAYAVTEGKVPTSAAQMAILGVRATRASYGAHYVPSSTAYNLLYCYNFDGSDYALVAGSKSGKVFMFTAGGVKDYPGQLATYTTTCANAGISGTPTTAGGIWGYYSDAWQSWT